jgi:hypothetical protein
MGNFFTEIERCIRLGVSYDLLWDLEDLRLSDYREVVRIREDGKVEVITGGEVAELDGPRTPGRPPGRPPGIAIEASGEGSSTPTTISAKATVVKGSAPVYYTVGANGQGVYVNDVVLWELFGPEPQDYRHLNFEARDRHAEEGDAESTAEIRFDVERSGVYRLRAATADLAGRTAVTWEEIQLD